MADQMVVQVDFSHTLAAVYPCAVGKSKGISSEGIEVHTQGAAIPHRANAEEADQSGV